MFNEDEDWNDEREAQILSKTVLSNTKKKTVRCTSVKQLKVVGKSSLMRTLKTLGSVPEWKSDSHQQDSDEDTEEAPPQNKTKKTKRRKKRKHTEEQQENGDQCLKEKKSTPKKRKKDDKIASPKARGTSSGEGMDKEMTKPALVNVNNPQNTERMSRKQWKNKMKNKRKCKNKYSQKQPEEEINKAKSAGKHEPKEKVKDDLHSNDKSEKNSRKKNKDGKPLKKKHTEEETNEKKCMPVQKNAPEYSADGSEQQTCERAVEVTANQQPFPTKRLKLEQSKAQSLKRQKLQRMLQSRETEHQETEHQETEHQETEHHESPAGPKNEPAASEEEVKQDRSASLRSRMEQRLEAARFRYINEVLYSTSSGEAKRMFKQDPQAFWIYHRGYTAQVHRWPANPVDAIISYIQKRPSSLVVADFGCGDCKIARSVKNRVHSFDLAAACELVTVCDMAHVPLDNSSVDIAVFCLSLMGTNLPDFLAEANRVLKMQGVLKIAEVASRFDNVRNFISALSTLGFKMVSKDTENSHFYSFEFVKMKKAPENVKKVGLQLKPCVYKKR